VVKLPDRQNTGGGGARNQHGLTAKEEAFARHVAEGNTQSEAYRLSYSAENMKPQTIWHEAYLTAKRPIVRERIEALHCLMEQEAMHDAVRARAFIIERLWSEASDMGNRASERLKAVELLGKLEWVGAFKERAEIAATDQYPEAIKRRIEEILGHIGV
jgi:hypothetical protein